MEEKNKQVFFARAKHLKAEIIEHSSVIDSLVDEVLGNCLEPLESYLTYIKSILFNGDAYVTDNQLDNFIMQLPVYLYDLIDIAQRLEVKKGISSETAKLAESDSYLQLKEGTVSKKEKEAFALSREERLTALVFKTALDKIKAKIDASLEILSSMKKVQSKRIQDRSLSIMAGSSVPKF
jgi:hypothetical protein